MHEAEASAPGKVILFGEHAVVYGEPAIAAAVDLRVRVRVAVAPGESTVNGDPFRPEHQPHLVQAAARFAPETAIAFETRSVVPNAAGLGSSAALTTATVAALAAATDQAPTEEALAGAAYDVEAAAQSGRGSPTDTATSVHGGGVLVDREPGPGLLWSVTRGERSWHLHDVRLPPLNIVVGNTKERARTADQVARVARFVTRNSFGRSIIAELGRTARAGATALAAGDEVAVGRLMDAAHNGLTTLGVSTPLLDKYCNAARRAGALGAKLTGSGGGGSMIALAADPAPVLAALRRAGCRDAFTVTLGAAGARAAPGEGPEALA